MADDPPINTLAGAERAVNEHRRICPHGHDTTVSRCTWCERGPEAPEANDPRAISELLVDAEVALRNYLVTKHQALQTGGCCLDPDWRGHLCSYHQGYADGIDLVLDHSSLLDEFIHDLKET